MLTTIIQNHVVKVATRYKARFYAWTVVAEIFNDDGSWKPNIFLQYLGPNYIKVALTAARYAEPLSKLYIEEHNAESLSGKSNALYSLARDLKTSGAPLDGIGFEGHVVAGKLPDLGSIKSNVARFEALGLTWGYTQLGVRIVHSAVTTSRQTEDYLAMVSICLSSAQCEGIITSGITDAATVEGDGIWGTPPWTETLFGPSYLPVPVYYAIADSLSLVTVDGASGF